MGNSKRLATRNNSYLMQRVSMLWHQKTRQSMPCFMVCGNLTFMLGKNFSFIFFAQGYFVTRFLKIMHRNKFALRVLGGNNCSLIDQMGKIRTSKAWSAAR